MLVVRPGVTPVLVAPELELRPLISLVPRETKGLLFHLSQHNG
jgi:hypothetical protein